MFQKYCLCLKYRLIEVPVKSIPVTEVDSCKNVWLYVPALETSTDTENCTPIVKKRKSKCDRKRNRPLKRAGRKDEWKKKERQTEHKTLFQKGLPKAK